MDKLDLEQLRTNAKGMRQENIFAQENGGSIEPPIFLGVINLTQNANPAVARSTWLHRARCGLRASNPSFCMGAVTLLLTWDRTHGRSFWVWLTICRSAASGAHDFANRPTPHAPLVGCSGLLASRCNDIRKRTESRARRFSGADECANLSLMAPSS